MQEGKISFRDLNRNVSILVSNAHPDKLLGTHFTRFTCTKTQILTQQALLAFQQNVKRALGKPKTPPKRKPDSPISPWSRAQKSRRAAFSASAGTQFTCFTGTKVRILTLQAPAAESRQNQAAGAYAPAGGTREEALVFSPQQDIDRYRYR